MCDEKPGNNEKQYADEDIGGVRCFHPLVEIVEQQYDQYNIYNRQDI
jgi:hypothetical protein